MRGVLAAVVAVGVLLSGCGGGDDEEPAAAGDSTPAAQKPASDDRAAALKVAIQGYTDALLKGQLAGAVGYLDPEVCDDDDEGNLALGVGAISETADGATMKIVSVKLYEGGARGGTDEYELSKGAPDQLRRLVKASMAESKQGAWNYRDGEWYLAGPCEDDEASPEPSA